MSNLKLKHGDIHALALGQRVSLARLHLAILTRILAAGGQPCGVRLQLVDPRPQAFRELFIRAGVGQFVQDGSLGLIDADRAACQILVDFLDQKGGA